MIATEAVPIPAEQVIAKYQSAAPVDVLAIAEEIGISVWEDDLGAFSGKLFRDVEHGGTAGFSIVVNAGESSVRKRFTIAHEVAHFVLHRSEVNQRDIEETFYRGGLSDRLEVEANRFAADILMPLPSIQELIRSGRGSIQDLPEALEVSKTAVGIRLGAYWAD